MSRRRIDEVLTDPGRLPRPHADAEPTDEPLTITGLSAELGAGTLVRGVDLRFPSVGLVGVVLPDSASPQRLLSILAGDETPPRGNVTLRGLDVRSPACDTSVKHVTDDDAGFATSVLDCLHAIDPALDSSDAEAMLNAVGLGHLAASPGLLAVPLGPGGKSLTADERQRLTLAMALAGRPEVLLIDPLRALADPDTALALVTSAGLGRHGLALLVAASTDVAEAADAVLFIGRSGVTLGTHRHLLSHVTEYGDHWHAKLAASAVDLSVLGVDSEAEPHLRARLVTETYPAGDILYRQGSPATRTFFIISGHVEIVASDESGTTRRVAVLGPGNHCGDLRLAPGELRAETARALDEVVVRSLTREAISAGLAGLLELPANQRRVVGALLRHGALTRTELAGRLAPGMTSATTAATVEALLLADAVRERDGRLSPVVARRPGRGRSAVFERLTDL